MQNLISKYGKINLYDDEKQNQIYNKLLEKHPFDNSKKLPININIDVTCVGLGIGLRLWHTKVSIFWCHKGSLGGGWGGGGYL